MSFQINRGFWFCSALSLAGMLMTGCYDASEYGDSSSYNIRANAPAASETSGMASSAVKKPSVTQDDDSGGANAPSGNAKPGFVSTCRTSNKETNWTKSDKREITNYLASLCKIGNYFVDDSFIEQPVEEQNIGNSCFCYGKQCNYAGYERPELQSGFVKDANGKDTADVAGMLFGCDNVPEEYHGAVRSCYRSSNVANIKPAIYFPNGTCALSMSKCTPSDECTSFDKEGCTPESAIEANNKTICGFARFGTYEPEKFTECPVIGGVQSVLVDFLMNISIQTLGRKAKLDVRVCFQGCKKDSDCHGYNVFDPLVQGESQTRCVKTMPRASDGVVAGVCFDKRTIIDADPPELTLVHPGDWALD